MSLNRSGNKLYLDFSEQLPTWFVEGNTSTSNCRCIKFPIWSDPVIGILSACYGGTSDMNDAVVIGASRFHVH